MNVSHVLRGSFQRDGETIRVTAQLIDANTGANFWSERYDRPAGKIFAIQTDVADRIVNNLGGHGGLIEGSLVAKAKRKRPSDLGAYECAKRSRFARKLPVRLRASSMSPNPYVQLANTSPFWPRGGAPPFQSPVEGRNRSNGDRFFERSLAIPTQINATSDLYSSKGCAAPKDEKAEKLGLPSKLRHFRAAKPQRVRRGSRSQ